MKIIVLVFSIFAMCQIRASIAGALAGGVRSIIRGIDTSLIFRSLGIAEDAASERAIMDAVGRLNVGRRTSNSRTRSYAFWL